MFVVCILSRNTQQTNKIKFSTHPLATSYHSETGIDGRVSRLLYYVVNRIIDELYVGIYCDKL